MDNTQTIWINGVDQSDFKVKMDAFIALYPAGMSFFDFNFCPSYTTGVYAFIIFLPNE